MPNNKESRYIYLPVFGPHFISEAAWWRFSTPDGLFPYMYGLGSFHFLKGYTREALYIPKDFYFFGDSGGFSVVTADAVINPVEVYRWQELNCDVGVILDMPPYEASGTAQFGGNAAPIFRKRLDETKANIELVLKHAYKPRSKFKWWGVIQGETHKQREMWYKEITELVKFKGYALSPKPSNSWFEIVSHLLLAHKYKIKQIHILQISSVSTISLAVYVNKLLGNFFDIITFDSATPARLAAMQKILIFNKKTVTLDVDELRGPAPMCPQGDNCPICNQFDFRHRADVGKENVLVRLAHTIKSIVNVTSYLANDTVENIERRLATGHGAKEFEQCQILINHYLATKEILDLKQHNNYIQQKLF